MPPWRERRRRGRSLRPVRITSADLADYWKSGRPSGHPGLRTGYGLGVSKAETSPGEEVWGHFGAGPFARSVSHLPAKKITVPMLSSGDADLGSLTTMLANTALDDG